VTLLAWEAEPSPIDSFPDLVTHWAFIGCGPGHDEPPVTTPSGSGRGG
jgi:hypothetical protein